MARGLFRNWVKARGGQYGQNGQDGESSDYSGGTVPGNTVAFFAGYGVNPARSNGEDIEPIPITPVRGQNWPEMQVQLCNGWDKTNYGKKMSYDDYLRLLTDSSTKARTYLIPQPAGISGAQRPGPAPANVDSMINLTSGAQPLSPGGPGFLAAGVDLGGRRNYG